MVDKYNPIIKINGNNVIKASKDVFKEHAENRAVDIEAEGDTTEFSAFGVVYGYQVKDLYYIAVF